MADSVIARNNVKILGNGSQPMVFAHGFGCDQNMWRFIVSAFEDDYKVVLFDYVGCGKSDLSAYDEEKYSTLAGYSQDVLDVCSQLGLKDVIFVGHSVSAVVGILAAIEQPETFSNLILIGPSPSYINDGEYIGGFEKHDIEGLLDMMEKNYIGWASFLAPAIMKNADRPELAAELEESFCSTDPVIARRFAEATFLSDNRTDIERTPVPSLIMQCSDDIIAPLEVGYYLQRKLPHATLAVMEATGHCPHVSHPQETIRIMEDYLAGRLEKSLQPA